METKNSVFDYPCFAITIPFIYLKWLAEL